MGGGRWTAGRTSDGPDKRRAGQATGRTSDGWRGKRSVGRCAWRRRRKRWRASQGTSGRLYGASGDCGTSGGL